MTDQTPERIVGTSNAGKGYLMKLALMKLAEQPGGAVIIEESREPQRSRDEYEKLIADGRKPAEIRLGDINLNPPSP